MDYNLLNYSLIVGHFSCFQFFFFFLVVKNNVTVNIFEPNALPIFWVISLEEPPTRGITGSKMSSISTVLSLRCQMPFQGRPGFQHRWPGVPVSLGLRELGIPGFKGLSGSDVGVQPHMGPHQTPSNSLGLFLCAWIER